MKQQTRLVALLLALVFCLSMLSGCQKKDDENKNNDDQQNQDEQKEIVLNTDYTDNGVVLLPERAVFTAENMNDYDF